MNRTGLIIIISMIFALVICGASAGAGINKNYTKDSDFDSGTLSNLQHNTPHNQLQLSNGSEHISHTVYPYLWVPNSNQGTVSKINIYNGKELARYRTCPEDVSSYANPSRTTVDLKGNCWVGNRQTGTAVKIGLYENSQWIDRNHDGICETSRDLNGDGIISSNEMLPWGQDECLLYEVILIPGKEGTYTPGKYSGTYANDYYNPGPRGLAVDSKNNVWIGTFGTRKYYYISGVTGQIMKCVDISSVWHHPYGALIDKNGILWSSGDTDNNILRLDPSTFTFKIINVPHKAYGLAIDNNNHLFISGLDYLKTSCIDTITGEILWTKTAAYGQGIAVTPDGDIWTANNIKNSVSRFSNDGTLITTISIGNTPTGVAVDKEGKVWVVDVGDEYIYRIDPATNQVDLSKKIDGTNHYGYSDMTGLISGTITTRKGTWTVIHDSGLKNAPWGVVSWTGYTPPGTSINVKVRSSNDKLNWSLWEDVTNGEDLQFTPPGRYLQIETTLQIDQGLISPILYDLKVYSPVNDIALTISSKNKAQVGKINKFILNAQNNGPTDANHVIVKYKLPHNFQYISSESSYNPKTGIWTIGKLAQGSSTTLEILAKATSSGMFISEASASSMGYDINLTNNIAYSILSAFKPAQTLPNHPSTPIAPPKHPNKPHGGVTPVHPNNPDGGIIPPIHPIKNHGGINFNSDPSNGTTLRNRQTTIPMPTTGVPLNFSGLAMLLVLFGNLAQRTKMFNNKYFYILIAIGFIFLTCGVGYGAKNTTMLVSTSHDGLTADSSCDGSAISKDGRYVVYSSYADNLVTGDTNYCKDVFVRDQLKNTNERVSVSSNGHQGNGDSFHPTISADGRFVAFTSYATNLVSGANNGYTQVFIRDRLLKTTSIVSISTIGELANMGAEDPSISADGHLVAFSSYSNNLVSSDSNSARDIFVRDLNKDTTKRISITTDGYESNGDSVNPVISGDGNYVAFTSYASNLVTNDNNYCNDIFLYNMVSGVDNRISTSNSGEEANSGSSQPSISSDGRYLAFTSWASNLVINDNNDVSDIFVYDSVTNTVELVSVSTTGEQGNQQSQNPSISADGRYIAFTYGNGHVSVSAAKSSSQRSKHPFNILQSFSDEDTTYQNVFIRDRLLGITQKVSQSINGQNPNSDCTEPAISGDGNYVSFTSKATNLSLPTPTQNYISNIYIRGPVGMLPAISATVTPQRIKSGKNTTVNALTTQDTVSVTAKIMGHDYSLNKESDGNWSLNYHVPIVTDGNYPIHLTATNSEGGLSTITINLVVDNTPPVVTGQLVPSRLAFMGGLNTLIATIVAKSDPDTASITATIFGNVIDLNQNDAINWSNSYTFWNMADGNYTLLLTAIDQAGNIATSKVNFTVDNLPPTLTGSLNPNPVRSGQWITIKAHPNPNAEYIQVNILGEVLYMTQESDNTWTLNYQVPNISSGIYPFTLTATYGLISGNGGNSFIRASTNLNLTIDNTPPTVTGNVVPNIGKPGNLFLRVNVNCDPDTSTVTASLLGVDYQMHQESDGTWKTQFTVPQIVDGNYKILVTAVDGVGNIGSGLLSFAVDISLPDLTANLNPHLVKSGNTITIKAYTNPKAQKVIITAPNSWLWIDIPMTLQPNGSWTANYIVPTLNDGLYNMTITATSMQGNQISSYLNFTVDNTPPTIVATINPKTTKTGDTVTISASADPDTATMTAEILGQTYNLTQQSNGIWTLNYQVPNVSDGPYSVILHATDKLGNIASPNFLYFTVQTKPLVNGSITPNLVKSGDNITINATTDSPVDTLTARILGQEYTMVEQADGSWMTTFSVPQIYDGLYHVLLTATNSLGSEGTYITDFTVDNTPPLLNVAVSPNPTAPNGEVQFTADTSNDAQSVTITTNGQTNSMDNIGGQWSKTNSIASDTPLGNYPVTFSASDILGNTATINTGYDVAKTAIIPPINPPQTPPTNPPSNPTNPGTNTPTPSNTAPPTTPSGSIGVSGSGISPSGGNTQRTGSSSGVLGGSIFGGNPFGGYIFGGNIFGGNIFGGNIFGGNILGGNILGGNILGGNILGGNILGGNILGGLSGSLSSFFNLISLANSNLINSNNNLNSHSIDPSPRENFIGELLQIIFENKELLFQLLILFFGIIFTSFLIIGIEAVLALLYLAFFAILLLVLIVLLIYVITYIFKGLLNPRKPDG